MQSSALDGSKRQDADERLTARTKAATSVKKKRRISNEVERKDDSSETSRPHAKRL